MHQIEFLQDLVIIFGLSTVVVLVFHRLHIPSIIGFLISGIILGPYGFNLIDDIETVKIMAEIGVVMLLFAIGLEFSLARLWRSRVFVITGGSLQVGLTIGISILIAMAFGELLREGIFWGFLLALSSTVIVLRMLTDRNELDAPHGRLAVGILIFQDLLIVPMMLVTPLLSGSMRGSVISVLLTLGESILLLGGIFVAALWLIPRVLRLVVRTRNREIFLIAVILICLGIALLTSQIGLSLAIGAFIAGLVVSESEYSHQALADIIPFRDSFNSLFFVSIGMLLDVRLLLDRPILIAGIVIAVLLVKGLVASGVTLAMGYPFRVAALVGFSLPQVGEFSFVLARVGLEQGLLAGDRFQLFLAISILSMVVTPFLIQVGPRFIRKTGSMGNLPQWFKSRNLSDIEPHDLTIRNHVIIAGYGFNGRNLARVLRESQLPYVVLEAYGELVRQGRAQGEPIYFGDVTRPEILAQLRIKEAKILVLALSDPFALRRAIQVARHINPTLHIVARTRYVRDLDELSRLGANEVVPEEFESSLSILSIVLRKFHVPSGQIARRKDEIRREGYDQLRRAVAEPYMSEAALPAEVEVIRHRLQEESPVIGKTLIELDLPSKTGAIIVAVIRNDETLSNPGGSFTLAPQDILVLVGVRKEINQAIIFLDEGDLGATGLKNMGGGPMIEPEMR